MKKIAVLLAILLSGCANHQVAQYQKLDLNNKTVTVPPGSDQLKGKIKQVLAQEGWKMSVYSGPVVSEAADPKALRVETYNSSNTKYRLVLNYSRYDICMSGDGAYQYDISFIDTTTGTEAFTLSGSSCESGIITKFKEALQGKASS